MEAKLLSNLKNFTDSKRFTYKKKSNSKNAIPGKTQTYVPVNCSHVFACKPQSNLPHCTVKICAKLLYALFHFLIISIF